MNDATYIYRFIIDAYTPDDLPMARLAEYMGDLARLFGETECVHFERLEPGSAILVQRVEPRAAPEVKRRLSAVSSGNAPKEIVESYRGINRRLAKDNATGSLLTASGEEVVRFPGRDETRVLSVGPFRQQDSLDGMLIRVGGKDDTVPAHLLDGSTIRICNTTRDIARDLAHHLLRWCSTRSRRRPLGRAMKVVNGT